MSTCKIGWGLGSAVPGASFTSEVVYLKRDLEHTAEDLANGIYLVLTLCGLALWVQPAEPAGPV